MKKRKTYFEKEYLDLFLVPAGLLIMAFELQSASILLLDHFLLAQAFVSCTQTDKRDIALSVISSNLSAATFLCSVSLTLSSLIGAWLGSSANYNVFESQLIYGDTRAATMSIKYIALVTCFLLAFSCFVHSASHFVHANYLISTPDSDIPVKYVEKAVIRGGDFWSLGLRALYLALNLILWFFGPIPMFVSSFIMVIILHYLDTNNTPLHHHRSPTSQTSKNVGQAS
ncbi:hypothetical protein Ddye_024103 [Dipteronia dyeriana]|uniref:Uncharacterized protein n=1 Tax=Dipteronia dyeriana TaxID=168575 RepID=A0AAD9TV40_9ROSI|nr:hypothetical protein Ddye_024103 [Dipteronia dyeriana]